MLWLLACTSGTIRLGDDTAGPVPLPVDDLVLTVDPEVSKIGRAHV